MAAVPWGASTIGRWIVKVAPLPGSLVGPDVALALLHDAVDGGEAEPGPLPHRLGGEERLEQVTERLRRHPLAGIGERQTQVGPRTDGEARWSAGHLRAELDGPRLQREHPALRHRVPCIEGEIDQHLLELTPVHPDPNARSQEPEVDDACLPERAAQHRDELVHDLVELEHRGLQQLAAAEGQELGGDRRGAFGGALDLLDILARPPSPGPCDGAGRWRRTARSASDCWPRAPRRRPAARRPPSAAPAAGAARPAGGGSRRTGWPPRPRPTPSGSRIAVAFTLNVTDVPSPTTHSTSSLTTPSPSMSARARGHSPGAYGRPSAWADAYRMSITDSFTAAGGSRSSPRPHG